MEFLTFTLPSGIRCIHKRVKSAVTHCALTINTGSRDELSDEHGIAHFVEHGLFKGTGRRRAFHINSRLENLGGELNAFTTKEDTTVNASTLKGDFPKAAELIADMVFGSTFPEHEIERERQVIVDEINSYRDIPQEMLYDSFDELMFAGSPLGRPIAGTARSVAKFDSAKLKSFVSRTYTPDQMVFSAIGNVSEKTFRAVCERCFGTIPAIPAVTAIPAIPAVTAGPVIPVIASIPATSVAEASRVAPVHLSIASISETSTAQTAPAPPASPAPPATSAASAAPIPPAPPAPPPTRREFERTPPPELVPFEKEVSKRANHQSHCVLGNRAYSLHDDRRLPLSLLVNVLGGPAANSRLNSVLRERNGLTYNIEANYVPYSDTGFVSIYFSCEPDKVDRCRELISVELELIMSTPLTPRQLSMAKKQFIGQFLISMDSNEGYMIGAAKSLMLYGEIDAPQTVIRKVNAITAGQITEIARDVFGSLSSLIYR